MGEKFNEVGFYFFKKSLHSFIKNSVNKQLSTLIMEGTKVSYTLKHSARSTRNYIQLISDMAAVFRVLVKKSIILRLHCQSAFHLFASHLQHKYPLECLVNKSQYNRTLGHVANTVEEVAYLILTSGFGFDFSPYYF